MDDLLSHNLSSAPDLPELTIRNLLASSTASPVACLAYSQEPPMDGSNIWPDLTNSTEIPAKWTPIAGLCGLPESSAPSSSSTGSSSKREIPVRKKMPPKMDEEPIVSKVTWPMDEDSHLLPAEILDIVLAYLSRDDLKALRLTCGTLRALVSDKFFKSVVIPFNAGIYGMLLPLGQEKEKSEVPLLSSQNVLFLGRNDPTLYGDYALDIFSAFGHKVKKFGMSFDVTETALSSIPRKGLYQSVTAYWGKYDWPLPDYQRFDSIANLENVADETPSMKTTFSRLRDVKEIAISIDSGMGYLHGSDISLYDQVFSKSSTVFGSHYCLPERRAQSQREFWDMLKKLLPKQSESDADDDPPLVDLGLDLCTVPISIETFNQLVASNIELGLGPAKPPRLKAHFVCPNGLTPQPDSQKQNAELRFLDIEEEPESTSHDISKSGIAIVANYASIRPLNGESRAAYMDERLPALQPNSLSASQLQWLLETQWAQQAFISSYMVAVMDNPDPFTNVHHVNLSGMSVQHFTMLNRNDFWNSLPQLESITILALGQWRTIEKDVANWVYTRAVEPVNSLNPFEKLLSTISRYQNVTSLNIGWACGGEHETGHFGRNQHLMPAPIIGELFVLSGMSQFAEIYPLSMPHIESLTITNSWIPPAALIKFLQRHASTLKSLTLDSVSLTGQPISLPWIARPVASASSASFFQVHVNAPVLQNTGAHPAIIQVPQHAATNRGYHIPHNRARQPNNRNHRRPPSPDRNRILGPFRCGTWPWMLEVISPLPSETLPHPLHNYRFSAQSIHTELTVLRKLTIRSCGYAHVAGLFDYDDVMIATPRAGSVSHRLMNIASSIQGNSNYQPLLGLATIRQYMPQAEEHGLVDAWGCQIGPWDNGEAGLYDGWKRVGTGRFSGTIEVVD